jgi:hypothetical protein
VSLHAPLLTQNPTPSITMVDLNPIMPATTQTTQSVAPVIDMTTAIDATILEDIPFDETPFDESIPPDFGSADSEDEWDEDDLSHEDLRRTPLRRSSGMLPFITRNYMKKN